MRRAISPTIWAFVFAAAAVVCVWLYSVSGPTGKAWLPNIGTGFATLALTVTLVDWIVRRAEAARLAPWANRALREIGSSYRGVIWAVALDYKETHKHAALPIPRASLDVLDLWVAQKDDADTRRAYPPDELPHVLSMALHAASSMQQTLETDRPALTPELIAAIDEYEEDVKLAASIYWGLPETEPLERERTAIEHLVLTTRDFGVVLFRSDRQFNLDGGTFLFAKPDTWGTEPVLPEQPST